MTKRHEGRTPTYELAPLYELSDAGSIKTWYIKIFDYDTSADIVTYYGVIGGKIQETSDTINTGKSGLSFSQQALSEATSKWTRKRKQGYVDSIEKAENGEIDSIIEGGVMPMLAQVYAKHGDKINYPAFAQPKLDGMRCIAIKKGNDVTLWSRSRKPINSVPHIAEAIREQFNGVYEIILDGELYNHELKSDFEKIISAVRKDYPTPESELIEYHIYDTVATIPFHARTKWVGGLLAPLVSVETSWVMDEIEMFNRFQNFLSEGYEGLMVRDGDAFYESNRRSYSLQKVKEFDDAEFLIIGAQEGRGKLQGTLGTFTCVTSSGAEFDVKMTGDQVDNGKYLADSSLWEGKLLTVKYQGITNKNGVPRFPVGLRIREVE